MSDLYSADDDHPLKSTEVSFSNLSVSEDNTDKINAELQSVAVDWKPLRSTTVCACSTPFDQIVRKVSSTNFGLMIEREKKIPTFDFFKFCFW